MFAKWLKKARKGAATQRLFLPQRMEEVKKFLQDISNRTAGALGSLFKFIATINTRLRRFK